jgi:lysophospholipase L1-like esterase
MHHHRSSRAVRARRRTRVAAFAATVLMAAVTAPALTGTSAQAASSKDPTIVVIGDSITSFYNDSSSSSKRGWWSFLGSRLKLKEIRYASSGSGFARGQGCRGSTFASRITLAEVEKAIRRARVVVIAGGVNDYQQCVDGKNQPYDRARLNGAVRVTMTRMAALTSASRVYVTAPWGPAAKIKPARNDITSIIKTQALAAGFQYVDTAHGTLWDGRTSDGIHPNLAGSKQIYRDLVARSDILRWERGTDHVTRTIEPPTVTPFPTSP